MELDLEVCARLWHGRSQVARRLFESHRLFGGHSRHRVWAHAIDADFCAQLQITDSNRSRVVDVIARAGELISTHCSIYEISIQAMRSRHPGSPKLFVRRLDLAKEARETLVRDARAAREAVASLRAHPRPEQTSLTL